MIHRNYTRLSAADRAVADEAFEAAQMAIRGKNRLASNTDAAERLVEAVATYMLDSGGTARVSERVEQPFGNLTAPGGAEHESYGA